MAEKEFEGQTAVVTGGANGLGFAIARLLAERGAKIALWDIDKDTLRQAKERLTQQGAEVRTYEADVTDEASIRRARDAVLKDFGNVQVLVNNAGIYPHATLREITPEAWKRMFDVNTLSMLLVSRAFVDNMAAQKYGRIVTIVSEDAYIPKPTIAHYGASKAALLPLIRTFALEQAPNQILVTGVAPGPIATDRAKGQSWLAEHTKQIPLGRAAEPDDIAEVAAFLGSKRNRFVTGETVIASGGRYMF